jgi:hypothetical protein
MRFFIFCFFIFFGNKLVATESYEINFSTIVQGDKEEIDFAKIILKNNNHYEIEIFTERLINYYTAKSFLEGNLPQNEYQKIYAALFVGEENFKKILEHLLFKYEISKKIKDHYTSAVIENIIFNLYVYFFKNTPLIENRLPHFPTKFRGSITLHERILKRVLETIFSNETQVIENLSSIHMVSSSPYSTLSIHIPICFTESLLKTLYGIYSDQEKLEVHRLTIIFIVNFYKDLLNQLRTHKSFSHIEALLKTTISFVLDSSEKFQEEFVFVFLRDIILDRRDGFFHSHVFLDILDILYILYDKEETSEDIEREYQLLLRFLPRFYKELSTEFQSTESYSRRRRIETLLEIFKNHKVNKFISNSIKSSEVLALLSVNLHAAGFFYSLFLIKNLEIDPAISNHLYEMLNEVKLNFGDSKMKQFANVLHSNLLEIYNKTKTSAHRKKIFPLLQDLSGVWSLFDKEDVIDSMRGYQAFNGPIPETSLRITGPSESDEIIYDESSSEENDDFSGQMILTRVPTTPLYSEEEQGENSPFRSRVFNFSEEIDLRRIEDPRRRIEDPRRRIEDPRSQEESNRRFSPAMVMIMTTLLSWTYAIGPMCQPDCGLLQY